MQTLEENTLWRKIILEKYVAGQNQWEAKVSNKPYGVGVWRAISNALPIFKKGISYKVANGEKVLFWCDPWLEEEPTAEKFSALFDLAKSKNYNINKILILDDGGKLQWNFKFKRRLTGIEIDQVIQLINKLEDFCYEENDTDDRIWKWGDKKVFSVKSYYMGISDWEENAFHHCPIATKIWNEMLLNINLCWVTPKNCADLIEAWKPIGMSNSKTKAITSLFPAAIMWTIWKERNNRVFEDKSEDVDKLIDQAKVTMALWVENLVQLKGLSIENIVLNWKTVVFEPP
ncbi:hypothetical protein BVC80_1741g123 [Macleaya cordata]|uniref:Reverse transcriptase zinc-binding domain n=1 Tax=Macleaya cordata TaxID=56857 RepID=A0A200QKX0_MACCD|nr:hypothetical protein BVC80_1741g123 [Macleaya cordata]